MIKYFILTLLGATVRYANGTGNIPRWFEIIFLSLFAGVFNHLDLLQSVVLVLGLILGLTPGWGKYFCATGLQPLNRDEKEIPGIDQIVNSIKNDTIAGIVGMSLRWSILFLPMFSALSVWYLAIPLLLVGPIYRLEYYHKQRSITEALSGALLGFLLANIS